MVCVDYNIIKEGDLRNIPSSEVSPLDFDAINALYDGDTSTAAATISGSTQTLGLLVEFGESYDVCYVDYFTDETNINNISIKYADTTNSGALTTTALSQEAVGHFRGTIDSHVYFVEIRHSITTLPTSVNQVEVIATKNDTLGFGSSISGSVDYQLLPHATIGDLSATATEIPLFNNNHFDEIAEVAVAPTLTAADKYLHIATSSSGVFYGIDDYGFRQPGPLHINLEDDAMLSGETINPQWERRSPAQPHTIIPTQEGIVFDLDTISFPAGSSSAETTGIFSRDFFTATSFTAEVQIRFVAVRDLSVDETTGRDFFFVLTNGYPLPDVGYKNNFQSDGRRGTSTAGVAIKPLGINIVPDTDSLSFMFRFVDGWNSENPLFNSIENHFTGGDSSGVIGGTSGGPFGEQGNIPMSSIESIVNEGNSLGDLTSGAAWHTWKISYDHVRRELSGWVDNIFLGSRIFREDPFQEACKLFIGFHGIGGVRWMLRNFKIWPDRVYRQRDVALSSNGGVASATVSGTSDNVAKINDGDDSTVYIGPEPTGLAKIRVDFDQEYDVTYYSIRQKDQGEGTTVFGKTYFPDVARTAIVDMGGQKLQTHLYPNVGTDVLRSPTFSGTATVCSGVNYIEWQFVDYDETAQPNGALAVESIKVFAEEWVDVAATPDENPSLIPWVEGRWKNIKQYGQNALALRWIESPEAAYWPFPEYFFTFVNYGFSTAVNGRQFSQVEDYHHSESLFAAPGATGAGDYTQWHSATQPVPVPFYIWRYFEEDSEVGAVFFDSDTLRPSNVADEFKLQYLRDEGDPSLEEDWVDIPPVSAPYTRTDNEGDILYGRYHDYLIANNDGEFYTSYYSLPDDSEGSSTGFGIGGSFTLSPAISDPLLPSVGFSFHVPLNVGPANGLAAYIKFDEPIKTRGIRLVVNNPTIESGKESGGSSTPGETRNDFALENFRVIRTHGAAVYTSPVLDTGTKQNTERIRANLTLPSGTGASVFVRSSDDPPLYQYDVEYETWRSRGILGSNDFPVGTVGNHNQAITVGDKIYFILTNAPLVYDEVLDSWSQENGSYPAGTVEGESNFVDDGLAATSSSSILPDDRVYDNVAYLNGVIYVAAYSTGSTRIPRLMKLDLENNPVWRAIPEQRPPQTEQASMVGYDNKLYFFGQSGDVFYFDVLTANWVQVSNDLPTHGGTRNFLTTAVYKSKIYIIGGSSGGTFNVDIFDPAAETFDSGALSPAYLKSHQAVPVEAEGAIYVMPVLKGGGGESWASIKYLPEEDRWQYAESLMWDRDRTGTGNVARFYFPYKDYIYKVSSDQNLSRTVVAREDWKAGKTPDLRDPVWGAASAVRHLPWKKLGTGGELFAQNRYVQLKAELYSYDRLNSPTLEGIKVVLPQQVEVTASGTNSVYVKVGVSPEEKYWALYTGDTRSISPENFPAGVFNILASNSSDGLDWKYPTTVSGAYQSGTDDIGVAAPWVIQESVTDNDVWFTRRVAGTTLTTNSIIYTNTSNLETFAGFSPVLSFSEGVVSQTENAIDWPCVVKESASNYHMWYTGYDTSNVRRIFHAASSNKTTWSGHQVVVDIGADVIFGYDNKEAYRASVLLEDGLFRMWYTGVDSVGTERILYRESSDGVSWNAPSLNIDTGSMGTLDESGAAKPYVVVDSGTYYMYYFGLFNGVEQCIRATSPDGFGWDNFTAALPPAGLQGTLDGDAIRDVFVLITSDPVIPGEVITSSKLKLHNKGAAL